MTFVAGLVLVRHLLCLVLLGATIVEKRDEMLLFEERHLRGLVQGVEEEGIGMGDGSGAAQIFPPLLDSGQQSHLKVIKEIREVVHPSTTIMLLGVMLEGNPEETIEEEEEVGMVEESSSELSQGATTGVTLDQILGVTSGEEGESILLEGHLLPLRLIVGMWDMKGDLEMLMKGGEEEEEGTIGVNLIFTQYADMILHWEFPILSV